MRDRLILYAAFCAFAAWHLDRLQQHGLGYALVAALALLALAPALVQARLGWRWGAAALAAMTVVGYGIASGDWPLRPHLLGAHGYVERLGSTLATGSHDWFAVELPYQRGASPELHAVVVLVSLLILAAFAQLWVARPRPLAAAAVAFAPFAVTSTVFTLPHTTVRAVLYLALALSIFAIPRGAGLAGEGLVRTLGLGAGVVVLAAIVAGVPGVAKGAFLDWTNWNLHGSADQRVGVSYVWNQDYGGLQWPKQTTEVVRISSPIRSYWRATTLEVFNGISWIEDPIHAENVPAGGSVPVPPTAAHSGGRVATVRVKVEALDEPYLLAPGQPVRYQAPSSGGPADLFTSGVVRTDESPTSGSSYSVTARFVDPQPTRLRAAGTSYPADVYLHSVVVDTLSWPIPRFGAPGRNAVVERLLATQEAGQPAWVGWGKAYAIAERVTRNARTPYDAVVALEEYFRTHYGYDEHVSLNAVTGEAPLAYWMTHDRAGYCQMFSGSMTELLRLLGIPARVAEGFTTGTYDRTIHAYRVTDRDAHAWVEVYFPRYGWLPFDPTPTRALPTFYSSSSASFNPLGNRGGTKVPAENAFHHREGGTTGQSATQSAGSGGGGHRNPLEVIAALIALALALLVTFKRLRVEWRWRRRDPRRRAAAARSELLAYALDQGAGLSRSLTNRELARELRHEFAVDTDRWCTLVDRASYARPTSAASAAAELRSATRGLRLVMRRTLTPLDRVRGAVSLRSLLGP